jgi:hypothetical protein
MTMRKMTLLFMALIASTSLASAQTIPMVNGDFESGTLIGWTPGGIDGGTATLVQEGTCFSHYNTQGITLSGSFAVNIRSSAAGATNSVGVLTSDTFVAGSSVTFNALSEADDAHAASENPVAFEARLLDTSDNILLSQVLKTNIVGLNDSKESCVGELRDAAFSNHSIDTSAFSGETVKLQFRQHTNIPEWGFFTLVDDVRISPPNPTISLGVIGCITCQEGGRLTVQAHIVNPRSTEVVAEVRAGGRSPEGTAVNIFGRQYMELRLPPGANKTVTLVDRPVPAGVPAGTWTVEATLLELELGTTFSRDAKTFEIRP